MQTYSLVKFWRYQWFAVPGGPSCELPADGINVYVRNESGVPIALEKMGVLLRMGDQPLGLRTEETVGGAGERILAPGEASAMGWSGQKEILEAYKRLDGKGIRMNFDVSAEYRSLVTKERFRYSVKIILSDECKIPTMHWSTENERIEPLPPSSMPEK